MKFRWPKLGDTHVRVHVFASGAHCVVRSQGLREANLPEVEIAHCPLRLKDVASNLVRQVALNGRDVPASLAAGKTIGGKLVHADQPLIEIFRLVDADEDSAVLRIADLDESDQIFPYRGHGSI